MKVAQMAQVHAAILVTNSGDTKYGVEVITCTQETEEWSPTHALTSTPVSSNKACESNYIP